MPGARARLVAGSFPLLAGPGLPERDPAGDGLRGRRLDLPGAADSRAGDGDRLGFGTAADFLPAAGDDVKDRTAAEAAGEGVRLRGVAGAAGVLSAPEAALSARRLPPRRGVADAVLRAAESGRGLGDAGAAGESLLRRPPAARLVTGDSGGASAARFRVFFFGGICK